MAKQGALQNTAFHESGHAVVACMLGVRFELVSIKPNQERGSLGCIMLHKRPKWAVPDTEQYNQDRARSWFEKLAQTSLAGQIAEAKHAGRRPAHYSHQNDRDQVFDMAMEICGTEEECSAWMELIFIRARNQLGNFWPAVEAVAQELMERETIPEAQARKIIFDAMLPPGSLPEIETVPSIRGLSGKRMGFLSQKCN